MNLPCDDLTERVCVMIIGEYVTIVGECVMIIGEHMTIIGEHMTTKQRVRVCDDSRSVIRGVVL